MNFRSFELHPYLARPPGGESPGQSTGLDRGAHDNIAWEENPRELGVRNIDFGSEGPVLSIGSDVPSDSDDRAPGLSVVVRVSADLESLSDWGLSRPVFGRERLADDRGQSGTLRIEIAEYPAPNDRNLRGFEVMDCRTIESVTIVRINWKNLSVNRFPRAATRVLENPRAASRLSRSKSTQLAKPFAILRTTWARASRAGRN
jgi:hypothetical protein